jgi:hypothetical protein
MEITTKYPRTYHVPFSKGLTNNDRKAADGWEKYIINRNIVITEKLDGENTAITKHGAFARSHAAPTDSPWSANIWKEGGWYDYLKKYIADDEIMYGENMYAIHSIEYDRLPFDFFVFAVRKGDVFMEWADVEMYAHERDLPTVPRLFNGMISSLKNLEKHVSYLMHNGSKFGDVIEGLVIRNADSFHFNDFSSHVVKYVRENHVQTDEHWRKNWKKATWHQYYPYHEL